MYFGQPCYGNALNSHSHLVYLATPRTFPLFMRKQNVFVNFISSRKKVNITSVEINMKQELYACETQPHNRKTQSK